MSDGRRHTDREYEAELATVRERLLLMGGRVESMVSGAVRALLANDRDLAHGVVAADPAVNRDELEIDHRCLEILARRQPMASDLRFVVQAMKMVTDIERIGDLAVHVADRALEFMARPDAPPRPPDGLLSLAESVQAAVRDALDAFVRRDAALARTVIERDGAVDERFHALRRVILARMVAGELAIDDGQPMLSVIKYLERVGDHGTNLSEQVIYLLEGEDVRHPGSRDPI
jgi:phosphate transport system protein